MITLSGRASYGARWGLMHPVTLAAAMVAIFLVTTVPLMLGAQVDATYVIASKIVPCAFAALLLTSFGWWGRVGFLALPSRHDLVRLAPLALLIGGMIAAIVAAGPDPMKPSLVVAFGLVALGAGFSEEALFRGVLLEAMRSWGLVRALVGSTTVFSLIHVAGLAAGASLETTITQVVLYAIPFGLAFGGLRLTGRSIWPLVLIHAMNNFGSLLTTGQWANATPDAERFATASALQLGFLAVLIAYAIWFVWRLRAIRPTNAPDPNA